MSKKKRERSLAAVMSRVEQLRTGRTSSKEPNTANIPKSERRPTFELELSELPKTGEFFQTLQSFNPERWWTE